MRTESVDSLLTKILEQAVEAQRHLEDALDRAGTLPAEEAQVVRNHLEPAQNHMRAGVGSLRTWVETPTG